MCHNKDFFVATHNSASDKNYKRKSVVTKEFPVATEIAKDSKKSCRDKENSVVTELSE